MGYGPAVPVAWKSSFEMEIPDRSPQDVRDLCVRRGFRLSGLRVRLAGDQLRARYVVGEAASAPLLKAKLVPTSSGTRIVGGVHWAAAYVHDFLYTAFALVVGLGSVVYAVGSNEWVPAVIGAALVLLGGWLAYGSRHVGDVHAGYEEWFRQALLDVFARK